MGLKWVAVLVSVVGLFAPMVASHGLAVMSATFVLIAYVIWRRQLARTEYAKDAAFLKVRLVRSQTIDGLLGVPSKKFEESVADVMTYLGYGP
jgi:hypothetical protein